MQKQSKQTPSSVYNRAIKKTIFYLKDNLEMLLFCYFIIYQHLIVPRQIREKVFSKVIHFVVDDILKSDRPL